MASFHGCGILRQSFLLFENRGGSSVVQQGSIAGRCLPPSIPNFDVRSHNPPHATEDRGKDRERMGDGRGFPGWLERVFLRLGKGGSETEKTKRGGRGGGV